MLVLLNPDHAGHAGRREMFRGRLVPCHEVPARLDHVHDELRRSIGFVGQDARDLAELVRRAAREAFVQVVDFVAGQTKASPNAVFAGSVGRQRERRVRKEPHQACRRRARPRWRRWKRTWVAS